MHYNDVDRLASRLSLDNVEHTFDGLGFAPWPFNHPDFAFTRPYRQHGLDVQ